MGLSEFKEHLKSYLSEEEINEIVNSFDKDIPHSFYLNKNVNLPLDFVNDFSLEKSKHIPNVYHSFKDGLGKTIFHDIGMFYMQEESSTYAIHNFDIEDESLVLDMCSAPGGKGIYACLRNPNGVVVLNDVSASRCQAIVSNVERLGISNAVITNSDFTNKKIVERFKDTFDYIILDAPCSGSGMMRKNIAMQNEWSMNKVNKFASVQKELILNAFYMLKPGGKLMYSTCSLSKEEDEDVVNYLVDNTDAEIIEFDNKKYHHIGLLDDLGEGLFFTYIKKIGTLSKCKFSDKGSRLKDLNGKYDYELPGNSIIEVNKQDIYVLNHEFDYKNLHVIRYGVLALERKGKIFVPTHHYAKAFNTLPTISLDNELINMYLKGNTLRLDIGDLKKGYFVMKNNDINVGLAKYSDNVLKNLYPKGLRHN